MDVDKTLKELQNLTILIRGEEGKPVCYPDDAERMANLFREFDMYLYSGGDLPALWSMNR